MFKRSQKDISEGARHWYQDKYQNVLVQRNLLALIALVSLLVAFASSVIVMRIAPLKSVEPYLLEIDQKSGITQRVIPATREAYAASPAVDRYFTSSYLRAREGYNINILRYNHNLVRLMSTSSIFYGFRRGVDPENKEGFVSRLGGQGSRDVRVLSMAYITNPNDTSANAGQTKIIQARVITTETMPNTRPTESRWVITITFQYSDLALNQEEQLLNPLGYTVLSYQIQAEVE
jgi:type IV secretion system protein VirB8